MIRVASLKDMVNAGYAKPDIAGMTPEVQLEAISVKTHDLVNTQYTTYNRSLKPMLKQNHVIIIDSFEELSKCTGKIRGSVFFMQDVYPVLTPMAVDSSRPFPLIRNKSLNIGALISDKADESEYDFATVQVPSVLPRFIEIPSENREDRTLMLFGAGH